MRLRLPDAVRHPVSILGITIATAMAWAFLGLLLLDLLGYLVNPYAGLLTFIAVPALFVAGLLLIPLGAWLSSRRTRAGAPPAEWPVIDLRDAHQRSVVLGVVLLTFVNVLIVSAAGFGTVHYMETTEFCGQVCHTTMEPEFMAHRSGPHAQVACVECHVGPGAGPLLESKLAGARQLYHLVTNQIPKPVPAPVRSLGRTEDTCGGCHQADRPIGDRTRFIRDFAEDEANSESVTTLRMHVGSPAGGIHRHIAMAIDYVATDVTRATIPYVRVTDPSGVTREFVAEGTSDAQIAAGVRRRMDCTDCHSRPAHTMAFTPQRAVDTALAQGQLPRALPFVRREAVEAISAAYADRPAALAAIEARLSGFYRTQPSADAALVRQAVASTQEIWSRNVFPAMRVTFGTYPNHLGHVDTPGCFRCHDELHKTRDGAVIAQDCEACHGIE